MSVDLSQTSGRQHQGFKPFLGKFRAETADGAADQTLR